MYALHLLIIVSVYGILGLSLNLVAGCTGLLTVAHAALFGVGAYTAAILTKSGTSFPVAVAAGICLSCIFAVFIAVAATRVRGDYFVIASFGFQMAFSQVANNWISLTGGPAGVVGIPALEFFGWRATARSSAAVVAVLIASVCCLASSVISRSQIGRVLRTIREDEILAQAFGHDVRLLKIFVFVVGAAMAAVAGALYASYMSFIDPTSFSVSESIFMLTIVMLGGAGSMLGSVVGAVFLVILPEALRFVGMPADVAANMRQIIYGGMLVVLMIYRPRGAFGEFSFRGAQS